MDDFENKLLRTTIEYLMELNLHEVASLLVESELSINYYSQGFGNSLDEIIIDLPISIFNIVDQNDYHKKEISEAINKVTHKHIRGQNSEFSVGFRMRLMHIEENWKEKVKGLISNFKDPNQGNITEIVFKRKNETPYVYNEMKFASKAEIKIALELEEKKVLFFPLPLAVRADTGFTFNDHREADFLICQNGIWGILEVSYHPDRFEKDSEKDTWFKKSGILCIQHYTAEQCFNSPKKVVAEFLEILAKYK